MEQIWKTFYRRNWYHPKTKEVTGYHDYQISNFGNTRKVTKHGQILPLPQSLAGGNGRENSKYLCISSAHSGKYIHRIVALHFIPNPYGYRTVNHKDLNKMNNHVDNLEWATHSYQLKHWHDNNPNSRDSNYRKTMSDLRKSGKWYTDGETEKVIFPNQEPPIGWYRGRKKSFHPCIHRKRN